MLLNVPPNKVGVFADPDVKALNDFGRYFNQTFSKNLLSGKVTANVTHTDNEASRVLDEDYHTYWAAGEGVNESEIVIERDSNDEFDIIMLQEYIPLG